MLLYQTLALTIRGKYKKSYKYNKCKISAPTWDKEFELLMDHILYEIFKVTLNTS